MHVCASSLTHQVSSPLNGRAPYCATPITCAAPTRFAITCALALTLRVPDSATARLLPPIVWFALGLLVLALAVVRRRRSRSGWTAHTSEARDASRHRAV